MRNLTILLTVLFAWCVMPLWATHVDIEKARQVATKQYVTANPSTLRSGEATLTLAYAAKSPLRSGNDEASLYVFNAEKGFVIVAGDDRAYPILGYSTTEPFELNNMPPSLKSWLQRYADQIEEAVRNNTQQSPEVKAAWQTMEGSGELRSAVTYVLQTADWAQTAPYNNACPLYGDQRTLTGCTATVMAILMRYHQWPAKGVGMHSYMWDGKTMDADFEEINYYWDKLPLTTKDLNAAPDSIRKNVAKIMLHCGISTESNFGVDITTASTPSVVRALKNVFKYNKNLDIRGIDNTTYAEWEELIIDEIEEERPILYRGTSSLGGHIFICDGYEDIDGDVRAHINWGWEGAYNGYYALNALKPGGQPSFSSKEQIIIGIEPDKTGADYPYSVIQLVDTYGSLGMSMNVSEVKKGEQFFVFSGTFINTDMKRYEGTLSLGLFNKEGTLKEIVAKDTTISLSPKGIMSRLLFDSCKVSKSDIEATDLLRLVTKVSGDEKAEWIPINGGGSVVSQLPASGYTVVKHKVTWNLPTTITKKLTAVSVNDIVIHGQDYTFTLTPDASSKDSIYAVNVNGELLLPISTEKNSKSYRVPFVKGDINIVVSGKVEYTPVTGIALSENELKLLPLASHQLEVTLLPEKVSNNMVNWRSTNDAVAVVTQNGMVETLEIGETKIIVSSVDNPALADTCLLTVSVPVEGISLDLHKEDIEVGDTIYLTPAITPADATNKNVTWKTSNADLLTVLNGEVVAKKEGSAYIVVASAEKPTLTDTCYFSITTPVIKVETVTLSKHTMTLEVNSSERLGVTISPENATNKNMIWSSSNTKVAEAVSGNVTAKGVGTAKIIVKMEDSNVADTCVVTVIPKIIPVTSIAFTKDTVRLEFGGKEKLTYTILPADASLKEVTWESLNEKVVTVNEEGEVTAVSSDTTKVVVFSSIETIRDTCVVIVKPPYVAVTGVSLSSTEKNMKIGESITLKATVLPFNASNQAVTWKSTDKAIADVDAQGKVTAKALGKTSIVVITEDGEKSDTCKVQVIDQFIEVTSVQLSSNEKELTVGEEFTLPATVLPENATNKALLWRSGNSDIASVNSNGVVTAKAIGVAKIFVETESGGKKDSCIVTVKAPVIRVVSVKLSEHKKSLEVGKEFTLLATIMPEEATNKEIVWSTTDQKVATVTNTGEIQAAGPGEAKIIATSVDGNKADTCVVTVIQRVTGLTLNYSTLDLQRGDSLLLLAFVQPANASNQLVTWKSNDPTIATVNADGSVKGIALGKTYIIATTADNEKTAQCMIEVKESVATIYVDSITVDIPQAIIKTDSILQLKATIHPANASNKLMTWSSDNSEVATVDNDGKVTAKKQGIALITVTSIDGLRTATSRVTVYEPVVDVTGITLNESKLSLNVAFTFQLTATIQPANATNKAVTWTTSDATIATVDANGLVTALAAGKATITVTTEEGDFKATCEVTVTEVEEVEVTPGPVGSDNKGVMMVGLNVPSDALFTGTFLVQMPEGFKLSNETSIADELKEELQLKYVTLVNNTWRITISKKGTKAAEVISSYREIVKIVYDVQPDVEDGDYEVNMQNIELTFDDGNSISEALITVPVEIDRTSAILAPNDSDVELRIIDNQLLIRSAINERITLYNLQGQALRALNKQANEVTIELPGSRHDIFIVRGDSGWSKKIRRD
ncbi:Ig-like domain-containing protein [Parabacteroides sp. OttesenSCG-928-N08]|nr:Ig-like domain-containing protein [Parabacteroides sp. OttesenSCG-928-N08]